MRAAVRGCLCMATASIVIACASSSKSKTYNLRISDDVSGALVCEINMTAEQFAAALTAQHVTGVDVTWLGTHLIGKRRETKRELVCIPVGPRSSEEQRVADAVAAYEVDGWTGRLADATNHHRRRGTNTYEVLFTRFVEPV
jgi:hypothetical protein